mmetsp:Transcript_139909/g.243690  ORF Transcript_139909/g.243690 Transcript_139909/m.243690 type:complete len:225 (-) Transcript_139909:2057-2731(-)
MKLRNLLETSNLHKVREVFVGRLPQLLGIREDLAQVTSLRQLLLEICHHTLDSVLHALILKKTTRAVLTNETILEIVAEHVGDLVELYTKATHELHDVRLDPRPYDLPCQLRSETPEVVLQSTVISEPREDFQREVLGVELDAVNVELSTPSVELRLHGFHEALCIKIDVKLLQDARQNLVQLPCSPSKNHWHDRLRCHVSKLFDKFRRILGFKQGLKIYLVER